MTQLGFLYCVRFKQFANPPNTKMRFEETLRTDAIIANGMKCLVGSQGGMKHSYGLVFRESGQVTMQDRDLIQQWIKKQRICCHVTLGEIEPIESCDPKRELTECVFDVDNLTDADRREAREYQLEIEAKLARFTKMEE